MANVAQQPAPARHRRHAGRSPLAAPLLLFAVAVLTAVAYVAYVLWPRWPDSYGFRVISSVRRILATSGIRCAEQ